MLHMTEAWDRTGPGNSKEAADKIAAPRTEKDCLYLIALNIYPTLSDAYIKSRKA